MNLYPAIDLRNGKVVRLTKGDFDAETKYFDDPVEVATRFEAQGASWVHVVDLDAARTGEPANLEAIRSIASAVSIPVQAGGGVRSESAAAALFGAGVRRAVIGTAAIETPELVDILAAKFDNRIAVGLDARFGSVATRGWETSGGISAVDVIDRFEKAGVAAFIVTEIERDGTLAGPDIEGLSAILAATEVDVIASGGVGELAHLSALGNLRVSGRRLEGAIVGKALYEGVFTVSEAIHACQEKR